MLSRLNNFLQRKKPLFRIGDQALARYKEEHSSGQDKVQFIIRSIRWVRPYGESLARWVYDGAVVISVGERMMTITRISCVSEERIIYVQ